MTVEIAVDGRRHAVREGDDLLSTLLSLGYDVPFLCWHGALGSVGACRQCAVRVAENGDESGDLVMACMTAVANGQRVSLTDPEAAALRATVIEWLMLNHPHDCPTCEEAGSCHLQDMTRMTGHSTRRATRTKRVHRNQWLGPLLTHEMNRCIGCYRCTRFYRHYAGGRDLDVFAAHDAVYFGRAEDGVLQSPFAGNLAEICPVGVFNDAGWSADYARKWDMQTAPAVCAHCSVGCNLFVSARGGRVRRVQNRYHGAVNGYFICDRGRFGAMRYGAEARLATPRVDSAPVPLETALDAARHMISQDVIGLGSPRASLEANAALRRLVGPQNFFAGVSDAEAAAVSQMAGMLATAPGGIASLAELEHADAVLILGEDLTATAPRAALALRQAARGSAIALAEAKGIPRWQDNAVRIGGEGRRSPIYVVTPLATALDDVGLPIRRSPAAIAMLARDVARGLSGQIAADKEAREIAETLAAASRPVIVAGLALGSVAMSAAAAAIASALGEKARLALFPPEGNSIGLALLTDAGVDSARQRCRCLGGTPVIALESDLAIRAGAAGEALIASARPLIAVDHLETATTRAAHIALPVAGPEMSTGTYVNHEGRGQCSWAALAADPARPDVVRLLSALSPQRDSVDTPDGVLQELASEGGRLTGLAGLCETGQPPIARAPAIASGRTADDRAGQSIHAVPPHDPDSPFAFSMEGRQPAHIPARLAPGLHAPGWTSANALHRFQEEVNGPLRGGDAGERLLDDENGVQGLVDDPKPLFDAFAPPDDARRVAADAAADEQFWRVTLHDAFLATEACAAAPLLAARAESAALVMHPDDAAALGLSAGDRPRLDGVAAPAPLTLDGRIARGVIGVRGALADRRRHAAPVRVEAVE